MISEARFALECPSPQGRWTVFSNGEAVIGIYGDSHRDPPRLSRPLTADSVCKMAARQLHEYFAGTRQQFDLPLAPAGTEFDRRVWNALVTIPFGTTWSYGQLARHIGAPTAARAVGAANGRNPISIVVPCHRVIGASGRHVGYAGGLDVKAWLLAHERPLCSPLAVSPQTVAAD